LPDVTANDPLWEHVKNPFNTLVHSFPEDIQEQFSLISKLVQLPKTACGKQPRRIFG
jgi:hypothetical protein